MIEPALKMGMISDRFQTDLQCKLNAPESAGAFFHTIYEHWDTI